MNHTRHLRRRALPTVVLSLTGLLAVAGAVLWGLTAGNQPQRAEASSHLCGTSHDALDAQEQELLGLLQAWRNQQGLSPSNLESSGALNAAAAWFAEHLVEEGIAGPTGHHDHLGRSWQERAQDCGYPGTYQPLVYGSGEGVGYIAGSPGTVTPQQALQSVTYQGSGVYIHTPGFSNPAKCVGVGRYSSSNGQVHAWIVVIAQFPANEPCPQSNVSGPSPTATPSPTQGATATPTTTPSPVPTNTPVATPTATPTPAEEWQSYIPAIGREVEW